VRLEGLHVVAQRVTGARAELDVEVGVVAAADGEVTVAVDSTTPGVRPARETARVRAGQNTVKLTLAVANPRLWWPNGLGAQPLYTLRARALEGARAVAEASARVGIRTLELRQTPDEWGKSFEFVVNGVPVFGKGGNWIPADSFPNRVTPARYRHLLESCRDANMNMVRVWGGGIYEEDAFYELCDELGLMVWQDFMFACSMYPGDEAFLESVRHEAVDNVKRLRNHPSIVLWCGNNEIETAWMHWGWKDRLPAALWDDYKKLFHGVLPAVVAEHDPTRAYWPSSPSSNLEDDADSQKTGDIHYWEVWHASKPFAEYTRQSPRFLSEYGFQSFPLLETVKTYASPQDYDIESPVMKAHQRHPRGNELIREYMLRDFPKPKDFESFLYVSQVLQAEGIKTGTEHFRRIMPRNMGALYWQVDDCWPVASWSGMDYYGRWKAMHYYARRFFNDVLVSTNDEADAVAVYVTTDRAKPERAALRVRVRDFKGRTLSERSEPVELAPVSSRAVLRLPKAGLLGGADPKAVYLEAELSSGGRVVSTNRHFFAPYKDLLAPRPTLRAEPGRAGGATTVTVTSDTFARAVWLSLDGRASFSDNFFDLAPGQSVTVTVRSDRPIPPAELRRALRVRSLADAF
jgi:beta-mannosidase